MSHEPFTWRGTDFYWSQNRNSWIGSVMLGGKPNAEHQLFLQSAETSTSGDFTGYRAWWEWGRQLYTEPVVGDTRDEALRLARDDLFGFYMVAARKLGAL